MGLPAMPDCWPMPPVPGLGDWTLWGVPGDAVPEPLVNAGVLSTTFGNPATWAYSE